MAKTLTIEAAAAEWISLKTKNKFNEKRLDELKKVIEPFLKELPEKTKDFHGWKFSLVEFEKQSFSLAKAKEKLDGRLLSPYISTSTCIQIRTSWQGGEPT